VSNAEQQRTTPNDAEHPAAPGDVEHVATFERIGRAGGHGGPAPAPLIRSYGGEPFARDIATYARQYLGSPSYEVVIEDDGRGGIYANGRTIGLFTVTTRPATTEDRSA
jgi:hypothetical protein